MKRIRLLIILMLSCTLSYGQSSNGINWDRYYITGSLALGKKATGQYADSSLWLEIGKDTTTKGFGMPKVLLSSYSTTKRGVFVYGIADSCLYQVDGGSKLRYMNIKDTVLIKALIAQYGGGNTDSALFVTVTHLATSLANYVPITRTITINGITHDLGSDVSFTISGGDTSMYADTAAYALDAAKLQGQNGAYYLNRANHTGTQPISSIVGQVDTNTAFRDSIDVINGKLATLSVDSAAYSDTAKYALNSGQLQGHNASYFQTALGYTPENVANKSTDLSTNDNTHYPTTKAVNDAIAAISYADSAGYSDTSKYALNSGQLQGHNAAYFQQALGYTAENVANKATDLISNDNTHYPTTKAVNDAITAVHKVDSASYADTAKYSLNTGQLQGQNGAYYLNRSNHTGTQTWSTITGTPTTIAGYGITDYNSLWDTRLATKTTDNLTEGSTNKYYTDAQSRAAISLTTTGTSGPATYDNSTGILNIPQYAGGAPSDSAKYSDTAAYALVAGNAINLNGQNAAYYLAWANITGTPTTLGGYGITDAVPNTRTVNGHQLNANVTVTADDVLPSQTGNSGKYLTTNGTTSSWGTIAGSGTVTSVGLTVPSWLTAGGTNPVTTSGTIAVTAATGQTANQILATPDGTTGSVGLRSLASGDLPTVPVTKGGTGVTTLTGIIKGNGTSAFTAATAGTDYQAPISLTTTGTSGAATLLGNTLNIPQYTGGGGSSPMLYQQTADASVTNSALETNMLGTGNGSATLSAGKTNHVGDMIEVYASGQFILPSSASGNSVWKLYYGATALATSPTLDISSATGAFVAGTGNWEFKGVIVTRTTGATGTIMVTGQLTITGTASGNPSFPYPYTVKMDNVTATTIDLTATQAVTFTQKFSTGQSGKTCSGKNSSIKYYGTP